MNLRPSAARRPRSVSLPGRVRIALCLDKDRLLGLGAVTVAGVPLRSDAVPLRPDFATGDAIHYQDFRLLNVARAGPAVILHTEAIGRPEVFSHDLMDEYDFTLATLRVREVQRDRLDWVLTPQTLDLDGTRFTGFALGFRFRSAANAIHRFTVVGTWELGGRATGNTLYHQSQVAPPYYEATPDTHFTTACLRRLDLWDSPLGNSYQLCPRWGSMQPFDFQAAADGVLFGYWPERHAVKSLIRKNPGEEVIHVLDEHDFKLAGDVTIPAKHILFSPSPTAGQPRPKHDVVNLWTRAMDHTTQTIRDFFGIEQCYPLPYGGPVYKGRNSVARQELAGGPQPDWLWHVENGKFYYLFEGDRIESHDLIYWTADKVLPRLHAEGLKRIFFEPVHQSDFTELAFACHAETGWHGDLYVSSVCGSHRYVPAEFFGGWKAWNYLADKARRLEVSLGHWVGLHLTPRAAVVREHPEYIITHANTKRFGGGYGHQCICSINWASGARQWFLDDLKRWHGEGGLEWLFLDSWPNLACLSLDYAGEMTPMQDQVAEVLAELQRIGYTWFNFEGTSPFGVHTFGLSDPMQDYEGHVMQGVAGQNDFGKYIGHEYMAYNQQLLMQVNEKRGTGPLPEWGFRYMANRSLNLVQGDDLLTYQSLEPLLRKRYLLPDDQGVRWEGPDGRQALFAFRTFAFPVPPGTPVVAVRGRMETPVGCACGVLQTTPFTAYRIG